MNLSLRSIKNSRNLYKFVPVPVIWSCDSGQQILCFDHNVDACHQFKHRLQAPTLGRNFDISHWFPCGAEGQADVWSRDC